MDKEIKLVKTEIDKIKDVLDFSVPRLHELSENLVIGIDNKLSKLEGLRLESLVKVADVAKYKEIAQGLKTNVEILKSNIKSLESKKQSIKIDEDIITSNRNKVLELNNDISSVKARLELMNVEISQADMEKTVILEETEMLKLEKTVITDSISSLKIEESDMAHKCKSVSKNLEHLSSYQATELSKLTSKQDEVTKASEELDSKKTEKDGILSEIDGLKANKEDGNSEVNLIKDEIETLKEKAGDLEIEMTIKRNKMRDGENRLLSIKKEVLRFILEYKDAGNKAQIAKFARSVENAA